MKTALQVAAGILLAAFVIGAMRLLIFQAELEFVTDQFRQMTASMPVPQPKAPPSVTGYKRGWIPGRELKNCMGNSNELNEAVLKCGSSYYQQVPVWSDGVVV